MVKKQMARVVSLGILVAVILLLPVAFAGGSVFGYTDNVSGAQPAPPPDLQPVRPPGPELVPSPQPVPSPEPGPVPPGTGECGWLDCFGCKTTAMSYTMPPPPPPSPPPPPLTPLAINFGTLPVDVQLGTGGVGGAQGGGGR